MRSDASDDVRVLHIMTRLLRGGSERRLFDAVAGVRATHTVIIGPDSDPGQVAALGESCDVVECPALVRDVRPGHDARALAHLTRSVRRGRYDVVHTHQAKAGLLGRLAASAARTPVIYHSASMANFGPGYGRAESQVFALSDRVTAPLVTRFFVVGDDLADRLAANGVARRRLLVVRSSLDLTAFVPASPAERVALRATYEVGADRSIVAYVGSLEERKGVDQLVPMVQDVARRCGRAVTLLVAGEGPLRPALEADADALERGGDTMVELRLLGHISTVAELMRCADAVVLPSSAEGLPQVLVQAASVGVPFVAFDVDGVAELLGMGATGEAVPLGDGPGFGDALVRTLERGLPVGYERDPSVWAQWDPDVVRQSYRTQYESDLGRSLR